MPPKGKAKAAVKPTTAVKPSMAKGKVAAAAKPAVKPAAAVAAKPDAPVVPDAVVKVKAKPSAKGKAAAKGKAKAKAKAKASVSKKAAVPAKAVEPEEPVEEGEAEEEPKEKKARAPKAEAKSLIDKILEENAGKNVDEVMTEYKNRLHGIDATIAEAAALEEAQGTQAESAKKELQQAGADVKAQMDEEDAALLKCAGLRKGKLEASGASEKAKRDLGEAKKELALAQVMCLNASQVKEVDAKRKQAVQLAEDAKKRQLVAIEATKKALEEVKALKGKGKGKRSAAADDAEGTPASKKGRSPAASPKEATPKGLPLEEQETVPAATQGGLEEDAEDIE